MLLKNVVTVYEGVALEIVTNAEAVAVDQDAVYRSYKSTFSLMMS